MPPRTRVLVVAAAAAAVALLAPPAALAHRLDVKAEAGAVLRVEAGYEYGDAADGATVLLFDEAGAKVARGTTDAAGTCTLPRPRAGAYTVTVDDGAGHRETIALTVPESEQESAAAATAKRNRWLAGAAGLAAIAGLTVGARRVLRTPARPVARAD